MMSSASRRPGPMVVPLREDVGRNDIRDVRELMEDAD